MRRAITWIATLRTEHLDYALEKHKEACHAGLPMDQVKRIWSAALLAGPSHPVVLKPSNTPLPRGRELDLAWKPNG